MAVWRDGFGEAIQPGDIVEDMGSRRIGEVLFQGGKPYMRYFKQFSNTTLGYEFLDFVGPDEAYIRCLAPKKEWVYRLNGHRLTHVEVLRKRPVMERNTQTVTPLDMPTWEAPVPIDWR